MQTKGENNSKRTTVSLDMIALKSLIYTLIVNVSVDGLITSKIIAFSIWCS